MAAGRSLQDRQMHRKQVAQGDKMCAGAKRGGGKQKLSWLDALRHKSEQSKQRRKPEATPSQIAGTWACHGQLHGTCQLDLPQLGMSVVVPGSLLTSSANTSWHYDSVQPQQLPKQRHRQSNH